MQHEELSNEDLMESEVQRRAESSQEEEEVIEEQGGFPYLKRHG